MVREGKGESEEATEVRVSPPVAVRVGSSVAPADLEAEFRVVESTEEVNEAEFGDGNLLVEVDGRTPRAGRVARVARSARPRPRPRPRPRSFEGRDGVEEGEEVTVTPEDLRVVERGFRAIERYLSAICLSKDFQPHKLSYFIHTENLQCDYTDDVICKSY